MQLINEKEINNPNLPEKKVKTVLISSKASETIAFLNKNNIECIQVKPFPNYLEPLQTHADMQYMDFGQGVHFVQNKVLQMELSKKISSNIIIDDYSKDYPNDVKLNGVVIGNKIICNKNSINKEILEYGYKNSYTIINTNQGYTKCSVCIINENALITDDPSIYKSVQKYFDNVLFVNKNSIKLEGMNYGFIGGCTGKLSKNEIAFTGEIESHSDHNNIIDFIESNNCKIIETRKGYLMDIGSIIPITEIIE